MEEEDTEVRQRRPESQHPIVHHLRKQSTLDGVDSDDERPFLDDAVPDLSKELPQASDRTTELLDETLSSLPPRWRNYVIRTLFSVVMIGFFGWLIYMGPLALMVTTLAVQVKCFQEIIGVGYAVYRVHGLPWFRSISWFFLFTSNYFLFGESMVDYFAILLHKDFRSFVVHHRFISFCLYLIGFLWFVLSLKKRYYMRQFSLFAWTHVTLLIVVTQSYLIIQNMFEGLIWYVVPVAMIITNDCMAYIFGFFFGKTPLIKLSPKKTWEGFIGGGIATVVIGCFISYYACQVPNLVCPLTEELDGDCERHRVFKLTSYSLPSTLSILCRLLGVPPTIEMYPFVWHSLSLSLFSSIIGPFGGFFASGFKRAFKIKDFGDIIPGHGGIMDRFDCQYLMATFVNVYISSFIRAPNPQKLFQQLLRLGSAELLHIYEALGDHLKGQGLIPSPTMNATFAINP